MTTTGGGPGRGEAREYTQWQAQPPAAASARPPATT